MTKFLIAVLLTINLFSTAQTKHSFSKTDSLFVFNHSIGETVKQKMADMAFHNRSTAPNYIVIVATDQITGRTKEICTEAPFVNGALDMNKPDKNNGN